MSAMILRAMAVLLSASAAAMWVTGCTPTEPNELDKLGTVRLSIEDQTFELWIANDPKERDHGLMFVTAEQMAPLPDGTQRGMLFVFDYEQRLAFWMKNTIIPLDIAYLDSNGKIVATHTMAPLDTRFGQYPSGSPARYAIEVNAGVLADLGVQAGNTIEIPTSALKGSP
ncbi:MAG: DUF192 domain-containing protein [Phycisphaerae bacterium]